jgi:hypothetical protein
MIDRIKIRSVSDGCAWGWDATRIKKTLTVLMAVLSLAPLAAAEKYQVYLSAMPFNDATQPIMTTGKGTATATLEGDTLSISGTFAGLPGRATKARLSLSRGPGIPGDPVVDLTLAGDVTGKVTGQIKLDPSQLAALRSRKLYIQIDSEKAPSGHLWGWLLEEHDIAGQDVPVKGPWYVPPFAVKTK